MNASSPNAAGPPGASSLDQLRSRLSQRTREPQVPVRHSSNRETIESIVIAFVLAFLFRTFEAEAFVIPTGSMAPTLMGRHKEISCRECGIGFAVGETEEQERLQPLTECVCPNCRYLNDLEGSPTFKGDRILVLKALYDLPDTAPAWLREPRRWDVVVFKFPEEPQVNYIKRLVGLPNEELRIRYGNIFTRSDTHDTFHIARKPALKQKVMRQLVYDNNHQAPGWRQRGWPSRWQSESGEPWIGNQDGRSFESPAGLGESSDWARLSYHHFVKVWGPNDTDDRAPREQLITDFYAYNAGLSRSYFRDGEYQPHWVGDLALTLKVDVTAAKGKVRLELVEGGERFVCEFDLSDGTCRLLRIAVGDSNETVLATKRTGLVRPGRYSLGFGNTDDRLTVWLDDKLVFGDGVDYDGPALDEAQKPTAADLRPASIAVQGTHVRLSDLVLYRDIYYTHGERGEAGSFEYEMYPTSSWNDLISDPRQWDVFETARVSSFTQMGPDEFMMMGDNSPRSKDGRLWESGARRWVNQRADEEDMVPSQALAELGFRPGGQVVLSPDHVVHRQLLIGRAFFVYWPHGVPFGPDWLQFDTPRLGPLGSFRLPFYPNLSRMKMIE